MNTKSAQELTEQAYENAVRGNVMAVQGTNSLPFPFDRA
jgi:hypothetical protein